MSTTPELIARLRKESPAAVRSLDDPAATRLLRTVFRTLASDIDKAPDGVYKVAGLGTFRVNTVAAKEGKAGGRKVLFKAAPPKAPSAK